MINLSEAIASGCAMLFLCVITAFVMPFMERIEVRQRGGFLLQIVAIFIGSATHMYYWNAFGRWLNYVPFFTLSIWIGRPMQRILNRAIFYFQTNLRHSDSVSNSTNSTHSSLHRLSMLTHAEAGKKNLIKFYKNHANSMWMHFLVILLISIPASCCLMVAHIFIQYYIVYAVAYGIGGIMTISALTFYRIGYWTGIELLIQYFAFAFFIQYNTAWILTAILGISVCGLLAGRFASCHPTPEEDLNLESHLISLFQDENSYKALLESVDAIQAEENIMFLHDVYIHQARPTMELTQKIIEFYIGDDAAYSINIDRETRNSILNTSENLDLAYNEILALIQTNSQLSKLVFACHKNI